MASGQRCFISISKQFWYNYTYYSHLFNIYKGILTSGTLFDNQHYSRAFFKHWSSTKILMSEIRIPKIYPSIIFQCFSKPVGTVHIYNWLISGLLLLFSNFDFSCLTETRFQIFLFWPLRKINPVTKFESVQCIVPTTQMTFLSDFA